jgi:hypothetical protein
MAMKAIVVRLPREVWIKGTVTYISDQGFVFCKTADGRLFQSPFHRGKHVTKVGDEIIIAFDPLDQRHWTPSRYMAEGWSQEDSSTASAYLIDLLTGKVYDTLYQGLHPDAPLTSHHGRSWRKIPGGDFYKLEE